MCNKSLLNYEEAKFWFVEKGNPQVTARLNMDNNKLINLADTQSDKDGGNLKTLNAHIIKPFGHINRFAYFMNSTNGLLQWTDLLGDSIALNSIGKLELLPAITILQ